MDEKEITVIVKAEIGVILCLVDEFVPKMAKLILLGTKPTGWTNKTEK